jgi:cytoskeletal protein RodZ
MSDLGQDLRLARERAGLSLQGLSARTKIREGLLNAIEHDDFGPLPAGLHTRGFLRAYAKEVGLEASTARSRQKVTFTDEEIQALARRIQFGLGIIILVAMTAVFISMDRRATGTSAGLLNVASTDSDGIGAGVAPPAPAQGDTVSAPQMDDRLTVRISPTAVVWVQATADNRRVLSSLIGPDQPHVIRAEDRLVLRVGDAGAFPYTVDGVRGRSLGASGEVREVQITKDNRVSFQEP